MTKNNKEPYKINQHFKYFFLDRDGVIFKNPFVNSPVEIEYIPGALQALKLLNEANKKVFIATNQGGIESGYLTWETLREIHTKMKLHIMEEGGRIDEIYFCPHYKKECKCRKPKPGMILKGISDYNLENAKAECCFIGDWTTDWQASIAAGIQPIAVSSGRKWTYEQVDFIKTHGIPNYFTLLDAIHNHI